MKTSFALLTAVSLMLCACGQPQKENKNFPEMDRYSNNRFETTASENVQNQYSKNDAKEITANNTANLGLKSYRYRSQQFGMVFGIIPIPQSWKVLDANKENILFEGPNGVQVFGEQYASFYYSNSESQNQYAQQGGSRVVPPKGIERVIQEDFIPFLKTKGIRYVRQFPLPQLAEAETRLQNSIFKSTPEQRDYHCVVTEWEDVNGNRSLAIIKYFTAQYTVIGGMDWGYSVYGMKAPKAVYEKAKSDVINAYLNLQVNPNWLQTANRYYAQVAQQSNTNHQRNMAAIEAQGQASRKLASTYSSISDSNHESWKRRNDMNDAGHENTIDGIYERTTMNDQNGNRYKVEGYYGIVWKGENDQYIGTNNSTDNPNVDTGTIGTNWEQLENTDDNY